MCDCDLARMNDRMKILVVDNDPRMLARMSAVLASGGYEVVEASGGKDALEAVMKARPDLVIVDVVLPDMSGSELCKQIKADPGSRSTFVVLQSGLDVSSEGQEPGLEL
jgi:CheY-like chemotaxis protein